MSGIFTAPRFVGKARSAGASIPSIGTTSLSADFDVSPQLVNATNIVAAISPIAADDAAAATPGAADVRGSVTADLVSRALSGTLTLEAASAANLFPAIPRTLQLEGGLSASATLAGTVDRPQVDAEVTSSGLSVAGQGVDSLTAKARVIDNGVTIDSVVVRQGTGELRGTGRYDWNARTYTVDLDGQRLTWRGTLPQRSLGAEDLPPADVIAQVALKFVGSGSIDRPTGEGVIDFDVSGGPAGDLVDRGIINVRLVGDEALVTGRIPSLGAFINGRVQPRRRSPTKRSS